MNISKEDKYFIPRIVELIQQSTNFDIPKETNDLFDDYSHSALATFYNKNLLTEDEKNILNTFFSNYLIDLYEYGKKDEDFYWLVNEIIELTQFNYDLSPFFSKIEQSKDTEKIKDELKNESEMRIQQNPKNWSEERVNNLTKWYKN